MRRLVFGLAVLGMFAVVQPQAQADDQAVAQRVVETIQQHKKTGALKGFGLDLQVENGVVWVKGEVANAQQHQLLIQQHHRSTRHTRRPEKRRKMGRAAYLHPKTQNIVGIGMHHTCTPGP